MGSLKCCVNLFFWKIYTHPPHRNIEPYTFVTLYSGKFNPPLTSDIHIKMAASFSHTFHTSNIVIVAQLS